MYLLIECYSLYHVDIRFYLFLGQKVQGNVSKNKKKGRNAETSKLSKTSEKKTKSVEQPESVEKSDEQVITKRKVKKGRRKPKLTIPRNKNKRAVKKKSALQPK